METNSNSKLKAITGSRTYYGLYDVTWFHFLKKRVENKKLLKTLYLVCKIHKACQLLQKTCANRNTYS